MEETHKGLTQSEEAAIIKAALTAKTEEVISPELKNRIPAAFAVFIAEGEMTEEEIAEMLLKAELMFGESMRKKIEDTCPDLRPGCSG